MIVGTAGHIDHGKTSLVRALTGIDTDRLKEEKARGITIDLGFAYLRRTGAEPIGFVDVPGHERFVHTMVAGASGIDVALLVVAADDGPMPQTREHLAILDLLGVDRALVVLTKVDLVGPERRAAAEDEIRAALARTGLSGADILPVSTVTGEGVAALSARLLDLAREDRVSEEDRAVEDRAVPNWAGRRDGAFRLAVDRSFTLPGAGTVVTGTVLSGTVATGDRVVVSPSGRLARVRSIHAQNRPAERGRAGERCALNLAGDGMAKDAVERGDVVLAPTLHAPTDRIDAFLLVLGTEPKPIGGWIPVRLHHGAVEVGARIVPLSDEALPPGASGLVQLVLDRPIAAASGDRFVLRDTSARRTLGGGRFLDLRAPARKRRSPERRRLLAAAALADPVAATAATLAVEPHAVDLDAFVRDRALAPDAAAALRRDLALVSLADGPRSLSLLPETWARLRGGLADALAAFHAAQPDLQGVGIERLRLVSEPRLPAPAFRSALSAFAGEGVLVVAGAFVRRPDHAVRLSPEHEAVWSRVEPLIGGTERFRPPRVRDLAGALGEPEPDLRRLLKLVGRGGAIDEVAHDHFFLRETVSEMAAFVRALSDAAPGGFFTAAQFRDRVENGRKVAIQILDFFDRLGFTLRRGDLRRVNPHRLDLFETAG